MDTIRYLFLTVLYSHNAFDEEQDSIVYTFGQPLDGYNAPAYDYTNPDLINAIPFSRVVFL